MKVRSCNCTTLLNSDIKCTSPVTEYLRVALAGSVRHNQSQGPMVVMQDRYFNTRKLSSGTNSGEAKGPVAVHCEGLMAIWSPSSSAALCTHNGQHLPPFLADKPQRMSRIIKHFYRLQFVYENFLQFIFVALFRGLLVAEMQTLYWYIQ
jgi:hypothetical protein